MPALVMPRLRHPRSRSQAMPRLCHPHCHSQVIPRLRHPRSLSLVMTRLRHPRRHSQVMHGSVILAVSRFPHPHYRYYVILQIIVSYSYVC